MLDIPVVSIFQFICFVLFSLSFFIIISPISSSSSSSRRACFLHMAYFGPFETQFFFFIS